MAGCGGESGERPSESAEETGGKGAEWGLTAGPPLGALIRRGAASLWAFGKL